MGLTLNSYIHALMCVIMILLPSLCYSQDSYVPSRATYYGSPECYGTPTGACGYKTYGSTINNGEVSGASYKLFRNGSGCGACYQVRCKYATHCSEEGTKVVVTDHGEGDNTDFILSARAYNKLALPGQEKVLFSYGVVDVEYKQIPCRIRAITSCSKFMNTEDCKEWRAMRRAYGAVWDMPMPPEGAITLRFQVSGSKWVELQSLISSDWKAGVTYDTAVQLD